MALLQNYSSQLMTFSLAYRSVDAGDCLKLTNDSYLTTKWYKHKFFNDLGRYSNVWGKGTSLPE